MTKYKVKVPPTMEQGTYTTIVNDKYGSYQKEALKDYNSARAHDGQRKLKRMTKGTVYTKMK